MLGCTQFLQVVDEYISNNNFLVYYKIKCVKRVKVCKAYYLATSNCKTKAQNTLSDFQDETSFDSLFKWVTQHSLMGF